MGTWGYIKGVFVATWSGLRHLSHPRMTLRYPEQKLDLEGPGYQFDAKKGVGLPGFKGRHILYLDKCTGCQLCAIACDGIAVAIEMQKVQKEKPQNKKEIWPAVDYGRCLPPWTPIMTINGARPIAEVKVGDRVLTHRGRFRTVTQVFRRNFTGRTYTFRTLGNTELLTVTEEHPVLVFESGETKWATPENVHYRTYLTRPIIQVTLEQPHLTFTHEEYHPRGRGGFFTLVENRLEFTPKLARLIGYYLAEGNCDRYRVTFDINKKEQRLAEEIINSVSEIFAERVSVKPDKRSRGLKLAVDSVRVSAFFSQFGKSCDTKSMPSSFLTLPTELQAALVGALYVGDGHYSDHHYDYMHSNYFTLRTTSLTLARQVLYTLPRLGIVASTCKQDQKKRKRCYSVTVHTPYVEKMGRVCGVESINNGIHSHSYVKKRNELIVSPVTEIKVDAVQDFEVFNLEVEEDNSYVAANQVVHNCVFCGLCVDACPFDALFMTNDYELSAYDKASLKYTPDMLAVPPKLEGKTYKVKIDTERGTTKHG